MKVIKSIFLGIVRFIYLLPALAVIVFLILLFGNAILGPGLTGSDNANFIALADWISKWFPRIPFWFPQEGAGMSFTASYPILNHLIVVLVEKIFSIPIAVAFRIWSLVTVALTSVGIFFLSFRLTKNQTASSLAAIFYPLAPITWIFLLEWGFAADQLSYLFISPVLIFVSLFLDDFYTKGPVLKTRIYFVLFVCSFVLLLLGHPNVFVGTLMFVVALFIIYPLVNYGSKKVSFKKAAVVGLISTIVIFLLSFFWLKPYLRYGSFSAQGAPVAEAVADYNSFMQNTAVYAVNVFNITDETAAYTSYEDSPISKTSWAWRNVSFPFIVSILALVGLIGSLFLNRKVFAFGLANLLPLTIAISPKLTFSLLKIPFAGYFLNWRATITPSRVIIPLLAGFGCFVLAYLLSFPLDLISKKAKSALLKHPFKLLYIGVSTFLTLVIAASLLWQFRSWPPRYPNFILSYGPETVAPSRKTDLRNVWRKEPDFCFGGSRLFVEEEFSACHNYYLQEYFWLQRLNEACGLLLAEENHGVSSEIVQLCDSNPTSEVVKEVVDKCKEGMGSYYPVVCRARTEGFLSQVGIEQWKSLLKSKDLFGEGREIFGPYRDILNNLPNTTNTRIDMGTSKGGFMMVAPFYSKVPELPTYYNQGTLLMKLWNYQISVFNQEESPWPQATIMYELSKYFGLEYVLLEEDIMPIERYMKAGWEPFKRWDDRSGWLSLWKFSKPAGLLRATSKPLVLVIGQDKVDGYFRVFHLANLGALSFDDALIVKGGPYADAYSVEELRYFDAVILEGHSYKNQSKGWKTLDEYVESGGSLLINTGWQYSSADWQLDETPSFFPINSLEWIDVGVTNDYHYGYSEIAGQVDVRKFDPLDFGGKGWNISSSTKSNLRDWAKVAISVNDTPLIAGGNYGSGKVVWMGLDLPGHIGAYKDNEEEVKFYGNLVSYLLQGKEGRELNASFERNYPDKLEITLNEASTQQVNVYWSEAYYPDFKAKFIENGKSQNLKVYKAGPGMTLFVLPSVSAGSKIIYEYKTPIVVIFARIISLATLAILVVAIIRQQFLLRIIELFSGREGVIRKKFVGKIVGDERDEEINY